MQVGMNEIVEQQHAKKGVQSLGGNISLEHTAPILQEVSQRHAVGELLDQDTPCREFRVREGKPSCGAILEVLAEDGEVCGFNAHVELQLHHLTKLVNLVWKREPFYRGDEVEHRCNGSHNSQVPAYRALDPRVQDLDGHIRGGHPFRRTLQDIANVLRNILPYCCTRFVIEQVGISRPSQVGLELSLVYLRNGSHTKRLVIELIKYILECTAAKRSLHYAPGRVHGVSWSI